MRASKSATRASTLQDAFLYPAGVVMGGILSHSRAGSPSRSSGSDVNMVLTDFRQSIEYAAIEVRLNFLEGRKT
jgi:hypothetical protein